MQNNLSVFENRFRNYAESFRNPDGSFALPVRRKIDHTFDVCRITEHVSRRESVPEHDMFLFQVCALFHDLSRFEQFQKYHTFRDADSFDHGNRSAELMLSGGFVKELPEAEQKLISYAIQHHNKAVIPDDAPAEYLPAARMIRDADKLSILALVYEFFSDPAKSDPTMKLDLPNTPGCTASILESVRRGKRVLYTEMRNVNDFLLTLFSWTTQLNYAASAAWARDKRLYHNLFTLLSASVPEANDILFITEERLKTKAGAFL